MIWLGKRGSSDSDWSSLLSGFPELELCRGFELVLADAFGSNDFSASESENGVNDDDATQRRKAMMSSETRTT